MSDKKKEKDGAKTLTKEQAKVEREKKRRGMAANAEKRKGGGLKEYFKGVKIETKKVVWPTRKELVSYTVVVIFASAFFALLIWGVDSGFLTALRQLIGIDY